MAATFPHKRLRLGFSLALALLMAALSFGLEFHHHADGDCHDNCPLCIALHLAQSFSLNSRPAARHVSLVISGCPPLPEKEPVASTLILDPVIRPPPAS